MESEAEEMAASAALLLLMGEKDPDGEVEGAIAESEAMEIPEEAEVGTIEESQAMETEASAVLRSMAAVAPKGVVVEAMEVAVVGSATQ